eukprot:TRINITY_DN4466_c0_g1_i6.p3 TRINITY_DN4466_c0_g1~~TRINITY_DN4466_c0_g1_i6.p3  ORF type:complete len:102 (+),score=6.69 TRINITY_DN4466_c0_g1_i6:124-429(+)
MLCVCLCLFLFSHFSFLSVSVSVFLSLYVARWTEVDDAEAQSEGLLGQPSSKQLLASCRVVLWRLRVLGRGGGACVTSDTERSRNLAAERVAPCDGRRAAL